MEANEFAARASDLKARLPFVTDRRRLKQLREQIVHYERQAKLIEKRVKHESDQ